MKTDTATELPNPNKTKRRNGRAIRLCAFLIGAGMALAMAEMALDNVRASIGVALGAISCGLLMTALVNDKEL